jgi:hypothetical protein
MTTAMTKRLARAVLIAGLALPATALLPATAPFAISKAHAAGPSTVAEFKSVLAAYGKWGMHDKFGEIWIPTVTPPSWHPYPACQWVYTKQGWYFDDNTPWGSIVHHYGRWENDEQVGWFWIPDADWSPGWVAWRQSDQWVGWAPLPAQPDMQIVNTPAFDNDKLWIFMAADKFRNGCAGGGGDTTVASQAYDATQPVTWFGLAPGALVDIDIDQRWTIKNIIKIIKVDIDIDIDIDINYCPPTNNPPPKPPGSNNPPGNNNPPGTTNNTPPGIYRQLPLVPVTPPSTHITFPTNPPGIYRDPVTISNPVLTVPQNPIRGIIPRGNGGNNGNGTTNGGNSGGKTGHNATGTVALVNGNSGNGGNNGRNSSWTRPHFSVLNSVSPSLSKPGVVRTPSLNLTPRMMGGMGTGKSVIR